MTIWRLRRPIGCHRGSGRLRASPVPRLVRRLLNAQKPSLGSGTGLPAPSGRPCGRPGPATSRRMRSFPIHSCRIVYPRMTTTRSWRHGDRRVRNPCPGLVRPGMRRGPGMSGPGMSGPGMSGPGMSGPGTSGPGMSWPETRRLPKMRATRWCCPEMRRGLEVREVRPLYPRKAMRFPGMAASARRVLRGLEMSCCPGLSGTRVRCRGIGRHPGMSAVRLSCCPGIRRYPRMRRTCPGMGLRPGNLALWILRA